MKTETSSSDKKNQNDKTLKHEILKFGLEDVKKKTLNHGEDKKKVYFSKPKIKTEDKGKRERKIKE